MIDFRERGRGTERHAEKEKETLIHEVREKDPADASIRACNLVVCRGRARLQPTEPPGQGKTEDF